MTIEEAKACCTDPFAAMYIWTFVKPVQNIDVNGSAYWLQWILVEPDTMKRIYINTPGPVTDSSSLQQYVQRNINTLREANWDTLHSDNMLYGVSDWCCGTCQECADWLMQQLDIRKAAT